MATTGSAERLATVEARWFGAGPVPEDVVAWFEAGGGVRPDRVRTDGYLRLPGVAAVGVKLRAGRLEIKARREGPSAAVVWAGHASPLEAWLKWSAPLEVLVDDPRPPLDVVKARRLLVRAGVQVELAALEVAGGRHWTFGLEAGSAAALRAVLASDWAATAPAAVVTHAGAYPGWLDRVADGI
jgi:hypothetical protein